MAPALYFRDHKSVSELEGFGKKKALFSMLCESKPNVRG